MENLQPQILDFVAGRAGAASRRIGPETSLADLGLDGDDALEFFDAFAARFSVDLSAFDPGKHFGPEGAFNPLSLLADRFKGRKREPVYVKDLIASASRGRW